jgi:hypothetical protein
MPMLPPREAVSGFFVPSWADYSVVGKENYSGPLQPHDYVKSRLKLIDDQRSNRVAN